MTLTVSIALLCCAAGLVAAPQESTSAAPPSSNVAQQARALPDTTIACLSLAPSEKQFDALLASPLLQVVADGLGLRGLDIGGALTRTMDALHLDRGQVRTLASRGLTIGLVEIAGDRVPEWLVVVDAGEQIDSLLAAIDTARQQANVPSQKTTVDGRAIWVLRHPWSPVCWTHQGQRLLVGASMRGISAAAARLADAAAPGSLAAAPDYAAHAARQGAPGTFLAAYVRPQAILGALQSHLPAEFAAAYGAVRRTLDLDRISGLAFTLARDGSSYRETFDVDWPEPREGILAEFLGRGGSLPATAGEIVPGGTTSFTLTSADVGRLARMSAALFESLAPAQFQEVSKPVRDWCKGLEIDLETDVLATFGRQIGVLQWMDRTRGTVDVALVLALADQPRLDRTLTKVLQTLRVPIRSEAVAGYRAHMLESGNLQPGFALTQRHLVVATTQAALQKTLERLSGHSTAQDITIPADHIAVSTTDLAATLGFAMSELRRSRTAVFARLGRPAPAATPGETALRALLAPGAVGTTRVRGHAAGLTITSQSDLGPLTLAGAAMALPLAQQSTQLAAHQAEAHTNVRLALTRLAAAQHQLRSNTDARRFAPLRLLVESGAVDPEVAGTPLADNLYTRDGFLLAALLGKAQTDDFAIVAWPADNRTGPVFAVDSKGVHATNEIIARAVGVALVEIEDVYASGFGSALRSGWRQQEAVAIVDPAKQQNDRVARTFQAIAALERKPPPQGPLPQVLAEALLSEMPAYVARACHALGVLRRAEDVPTLVKLATDHPDVDVRAQAMWALTRIRDARAHPAALAALRGDDITLRTLGANFLGALRMRASAPDLLAVAADRTGTEGATASGEQQDRVAAITALADIGDPAQLLPLAAAVATGTPLVQQALTYAFQSLSTKLAPQDEATTLIAVLAHAVPGLRQYAIQRLAELRIPSTARALEGRLAQEGRELLPLLQVAIAAVRNDRTGVESSLTERAEAVLTSLTQAWNELPMNQRYAIGCGAAILLLVVWLALALRSRARNRAAGETWAALAAPSSPQESNEGWTGEPEGAFQDEGQEELAVDHETDLTAAADSSSVDEFELEIGASGVFRANDYDDDSLAPAGRNPEHESR